MVLALQYASSIPVLDDEMPEQRVVHNNMQSHSMSDLTAISQAIKRQESEPHSDESPPVSQGLEDGISEPHNSSHGLEGGHSVSVHSSAKLKTK